MGIELFNRQHESKKSTATLYRAMLGDRASQFVYRHGWTLTLDKAGLESDLYDDFNSRYLIVHIGDKHLVSARLRPLNCGTMIEEHFPEFGRCRDFVSVRTLEVTRLCSSPHIGSKARQYGHWWLLAAIQQFCEEELIAELLGVVFPSVQRLIQHAGWPSSVVARSERDGRQIMLCRWRVISFASYLLRRRSSSFHRMDQSLQATLVQRSGTEFEISRVHLNPTTS